MRVWNLGLVALLAGACGSGSQRDAWAVGTYIGGGSMLFGPSSCTYEATPAVAELSKDEKGSAFMAKLVGPGEITEICGDQKRVHDVLAPTGIRIDGPDSVSTGKESDTYRVTAVAGARELLGVKQGGESPEWSLGPDCGGVADFGAVLGAQDTGGRDITRTLAPTKAGTCTITARALGHTATKKVTVK